MSLLRPESEQLWLATHPLFTIPLIEFFKRQALYIIHAAGFRGNGGVIVLPGSSGAGKSTLSIAFLRAGFQFLGDDMLFLQEESQGRAAPEVLAFPEDVDVTDQTAAMFSELASLIGTLRAAGWPKHQIVAENVYRVPIAWRGQARALVFPRIGDSDESSLAPMDKTAAFLALAPNVLLTDPPSCQAHLRLLEALVRTAPCYQLSTGRDFDRLPKLLSNL
jgi:hypothetical protein